MIRPLALGPARFATLVQALILGLLAAPAIAQTTGADPNSAKCPAAKVTALAMPHVKAALGDQKEVTIIALGSSSTEGSHASDMAHTYPALLQSILSSNLPTAHIAVLNRGVGGQDVIEELPRIERDVIGAHPTLVIWQVGANGAMQKLSPDLFHRLLATGVKRLQDAHVDVILMDNQRAPTILASPVHVQIDQAMADVAAASGAGLFARGALMAQWQQAGYPLDQFIAEDGIHHNDRGYRCVTEALATAMMEGLGRPGVLANR